MKVGDRVKVIGFPHWDGCTGIIVKELEYNPERGQDYEWLVDFKICGQLPVAFWTEELQVING